MMISDDISPDERRRIIQLAKRITYSQVYRETLTNMVRYGIRLVTAENFPKFIAWTKTRFPLLYRRLPVTIKDATPNSATLRNLANIIPDELVDNALPFLLKVFGEPLPWEEAQRVTNRIALHTTE